MQRWGKLIVAVFAVLLWLPARGLTASSLPQEGQDKPTKEDIEKAEKRNKKAAELYEAAKKYMAEKQFRAARTQLQLLRDRYRITKTYLDNYKDITERLLDCGSKVAVDELKKYKKYRRGHIDSWHGIQFNPPDKWRGIPPSQQYFGDMDSSESNYSGQNIRITRYTSPFLENIYLQVFKLYDTKSLGQLTDKVFQSLGKRFKGLKEKSSAPFKGRGGVSLRKEFEDNDGNKMVVYHWFAHKRGFSLVCVWRTTTASSFIISFGSGGSSKSKKRVVADADWKEALRVFDATAKTFVVTPRKGGKLIRTCGWKVIKTRNYTIEYATRDDYAKTLSKHMEKIFAYYRKVIPTGKGFSKCRIKLFDNEEDFMYYGQVPGAAAYWSPGQEEMVAYRFSGKQLKLHDQEMTVAETRNPEEETFHVMYHEGFHQYMYYLMGRARGVYVPSWLNEGMGDYFFGGSWVKKKGKLTLVIEPNWWRLDTIYEAVKNNKHVPLKQIFKYTQSDYYSNAGLCYAEGWAINYFFLKSPVAKKRGYNTIPTRMLKALSTSGDWEKATKKVFAPYDIDVMEKEWKAFVLSLKKEKKADSAGDGR